jgi:hypothetical protein
MSGLLPRNQQQTSDGVFNNLDVQTLVVSGVGYINNLEVGTFNPGDITVGVINGNPNLTINGGIIDLVTTGAEVNGDQITTSNSITEFTEKTIDSATNTLTITNALLSAVNVNTLINQSVETTASPTFAGLNLTGIVNDNTITNILGINGGNVVEYKNNISDTSSAQTFTNKSLKVPSCKFVDNSDASKVIFFNTASSTTGTNTTLLFNQTANRGITFPDANYNVVGDTTTQTLTNKLMQGDRYWDGTGQTIQFATSTLTGPRTWTAPDGSGTVLLDTQTQNVYNKTFDNTSTLQGTYIVGNYTSNTTTDHPIEFNTSGLTAERTITWPDSAGTVDLNGNALTLTNKTIDSATNTLTITNSPLSAANVNTLINQSVETTASPTFNVITATGNISSNSAAANAEFSCSQGVTNRKLVLYDTNLGSPNANQFYGLGLASNTMQYHVAPTTADHVFYVGTNSTTSTELARIKGNSSGIVLPVTGAASYSFNGAGDYAYAFAGGNYFSNAAAGDICVRCDNTSNSLNLGVGSGTAQLQLQNNEINLSTNAVNTNLSGTLISSSVPVHASNAFGATTTLLTVTTSSNMSGMIKLSLAYNKLVGTVTGYGSTSIMDFSYVNNGGTVTTTADTSNKVTETNIAGVFLLGTTFALAVSGTSINVNMSNTFADNAVKVAGTIDVQYSI